MNLLRQLSSFSLVIALLTLASCARYHFGYTLPEGIRSIHIPTFINRTSEPQIETTLTSATIRQIQKSGGLKVVGKDMADGTAQVELLSYDLEPVRYESATRVTAKEYRVTITAHVVLMRAADQVKLIDQNVVADRTFQVGGNLTAAKREVLPDISETLAYVISDAILQHW